MGCLAIMLLGPFQVTLDDRQVAFATDKVRALLAYLAVEGDRPHPRESLAGLLWPDYAESSARQSLSQALSSLRNALGDRAAGDEGGRRPYLLVTRKTLQFNPQSVHRVDVAMVRQDLAVFEELPPAEAIARLQETVALYRGPFLEGFSLGDSGPFEEWATLQREECLRRVLAALHRLVELYEQEGNYAQAQRYARRRVELSPLDEGAHRQLMRALALGGQRSAALAQYETCRHLLAEDLDVQPAPETVMLYEQIRSGALVSPARATARPFQGRLAGVDTGPRAFESPGVAVTETPPPLFVAREQELARLDQWLAAALSGQGRVGFVVGEPGSGKTALLRAFAHRAMDAHADLVVAGGNCNAYSGWGDPYLPFVEILLLLTGDVEARRAAGTLSQEHARRLLAIGPAALEAVFQIGPTLIGILLPGAAFVERVRTLSGGAAWEAQVRRALDNRAGAPSQAFLFDRATRVLQALARNHPLLLVLDDLQWADTGSISLLFHLGRRLAGHQILILGAYRPEEVAAGREGRPHPLQPVLLEFAALWEESQVDLAQADECAFVEALVDSEPNRLGADFRNTLCHHTRGHALFTVELWRGLQQRGDLKTDSEGRWVEGPALHWDRLPKRVEAVIAAHIARLPREQQQVLSVASVEGEEFHAEVVAQVLGRDASDVLAALSGPLSQRHNLVRAESLRRVEGQQFSRYRFRHYLFHYYLRQQLDTVQRAHLHGRIGSALEALAAVDSAAVDWLDTTRRLAGDYHDALGASGGIVSEAQMAWHWEQAGLAEKAALYYLHAATRALRVSLAYQEMLSHVRRMLDLVTALPDLDRRLRYEQLGYLAQGWAWANLEGRTAAEAEQSWRKSLELAEEIGDELLIAEALAAVASHHDACGELDKALALHERAAVLAQGGPQAWVMYMNGTLALTLLYRGNLSRAIGLLAPLSEALLRTGSILPWSDAVQTLVLVPWAMWCLGYPDQAMEVGRAALQMMLRERERFQAGQDANVLCSAICFTHRLRREVAGVQQGLEMLKPLVEEHRYTPFVPLVIPMYRGWVHAQTGLLEQGIAEMRQTLASRSEGTMLMPTLQKAYLAEALASAGRVGEGLHELAEALEHAERTGERFAEAELHRLKGELLLQQGGAPEDAEASFRQAIAVAQRQQAKSWELRATTSLARLLQKQGRRDEAQDQLAPVYGWFTEGFDTPDLQEAKALLDTLR